MMGASRERMSTPLYCFQFQTMTALIIGVDRNLVAPAPRSRPKLAGATLVEDKKRGSLQERAHGGDLVTGSQEMGGERHFVGGRGGIVLHFEELDCDLSKLGRRKNPSIPNGPRRLKVDK